MGLSPTNSKDKAQTKGAKPNPKSQYLTLNNTAKKQPPPHIQSPAGHCRLNHRQQPATAQDVCRVREQSLLDDVPPATRAAAIPARCQTPNQELVSDLPFKHLHQFEDFIPFFKIED